MTEETLPDDRVSDNKPEKPPIIWKKHIDPP